MILESLLQAFDCLFIYFYLFKIFSWKLDQTNFNAKIDSKYYDNHKVGSYSFSICHF